ncbi:hypothetical protein [Persicobacter psychrovividus]|uniref:Tetratricopeptide repeat protein n=1 Tax=Persicobacter psychrovividus TaxID=387638 RepID=A0ABM7VE22_9BACT|nr:hypothetical protein PEPS_13560 [Persicobacter psychrovividus]
MKFFKLAFLITLTSCLSPFAPDQSIQKLQSTFNDLKFKEAVILSDSLLKIYPADNFLYLIKGRSQFNLGQADNAIKNINKSISLNPDYLPQYGYRALMLGSVNKGTKDGILEDFDKALSNKKLTQNEAIELILTKIRYFIKIESFEEASSEIDKVLLVKSNNRDAKILKAKVLFSQEKNNDALLTLNDLIKDDPNNADAYDMRGFYYLDKQDYLNAFHNFDKLVEIESKKNHSVFKALAFNNRAFCLLKLGEIQKAFEDVQHSISLYPENSYAYKNRALIYLEMDEKEKVCEDLERAESLEFSSRYGDEVTELMGLYCAGS